MQQAAKTGFTLFETLLAIAVASIIIVASLLQYRHDERRASQVAAMSNVKVLMTALMHYYHATACSKVGNVPGVFPTVNSNVYSALVSGGYLAVSALRLQLAALVTTSPYQAQVTYNTSTKPVARNGKPVYMLQVSATLKNSLTSVRVAAIAHRWGAALSGSHTLVWRQLPGQVNLSHGSFWLSNQYERLFKQQENTLDMNSSACLF